MGAALLNYTGCTSKHTYAKQESVHALFSFFAAEVAEEVAAQSRQEVAWNETRALNRERRYGGGPEYKKRMEELKQQGFIMDNYGRDLAPAKTVACTYLDLYAGPGRYTSGNYIGPGSPIIFLDTMIGAPVPVRGALFEPQRERFYSLVGEVTGHEKGGELDLFPETSERKSLSWLIADRSQEQEDRVHERKSMGMVYIDPSGEPDWDVIKDIVLLAPWLDVVLYYSATMRKRVRICKNTNTTKTLGKSLRESGLWQDSVRGYFDRDTFVRTPKSGHAWCLIYSRPRSGRRWYFPNQEHDMFSLHTLPGVIAFNTHMNMTRDEVFSDAVRGGGEY